MKAERIFPPSIAALSAALFAAEAGAAPAGDKSGFRVAGISAGVGHWVVETDRPVGSRREDYGTWPALGAYFALGPAWTLSASLPLRSSFKQSRHATRWALGDGEMSLARRLRLGRARLLLRAPLYSWSTSRPLENEHFIGPGTVDVGLGYNLESRPAFPPRRFSVWSDVHASTVAWHGLAEFGSAQAALALGTDWAFAPRWKAGVNLLNQFHYWRWIPTFWDQREEFKFSCIPGFSLGTRLGRSTHVGLKAGGSAVSLRRSVDMRDSYAEAPQLSYYFGASLYQGF